MLEFRIALDDVSRGWLAVELAFQPAGPGEATFALPVWTPGSYLVREYSQHVADVRVRDAEGRELPVTKVAKNRWTVPIRDSAPIRVAYRVYARDLTVRTSFVTHDWAFWNGAGTLLWPVGAERQPARVQVGLPTGWRLVTGLGDARADGAGSASYEVRDQDEAVDTACLAGADREWRFVANDRPHRLVAAGLGPFQPPERFVDELVAIVAEAGRVFGGPLPFDEYVFLGLFGTAGRGGLEHAASSVLLSPRTVFVERRDYEDFLGLVAHEYLHVWNVKRMRPVELWRIDYERENPTPLLWLAEGFTAYYDDLVCRRAGVFTTARYLEMFAGHLRNYFDTPGRHVQSLSESSFDAWIQLYRAGENTRNVSQNYYGNGAVAAFCLDARIREITGGARCLDDLVRELYSATYGQGRGYDLDDVRRAARVATGESLDASIDQLYLQRGDFPVDRALELFGLRLDRDDDGSAWLGAHCGRDDTVFAAVRAGSPADRAGLRAGDELLAIEGVRVQPESWAAVWRGVARVGTATTLLLAREGRVVEFRVTPQRSPFGRFALESVPTPSESQLAHRESWLRSRSL